MNDYPHSSYVHFKDGRKEEIIFYRRLSYNPVKISILTPKNIYLYEEEPLLQVSIDKVILPRITNCRFYKYAKSDIEDFPMCERDVRANWEYQNDFDSISLYVPDMCK